MLPLPHYSCRTQAYVGAFLRKESKAEAGLPATAAEAGSDPLDPANQLYEIGTFAQVCTTSPR